MKNKWNSIEKCCGFGGRECLYKATNKEQNRLSVTPQKAIDWPFHEFSSKNKRK